MCSKLGVEYEMIELTDKQRKSAQTGIGVAVTDEGEQFILLRPDVYERLQSAVSDHSRWSEEELDAAREESVEMLDQFGNHG